jgi:hypothetical protein
VIAEARVRDARDRLASFAAIVSRPLRLFQAEALTLTKPVTVLVAPRQTGKSYSLAVLAAWRAFREANHRVLIVSAGDDAAKRLLADVRALVAASPLLASSTVDEQSGLLTLTNGSEIRSVPASERQIRGWSVDTLIVDEAAIVDDELLTGAALPTVAARPDARVVLASSPRGETGVFFEYARRGFAGSDHVAAFRWRMADADWVTPERLAMLREGLPDELARAELDAEFVDTAGMPRLFDDADIAAARLRVLPGAGPLRLGVDVARAGRDETVGMAVRGGQARVVFAGRGWPTTQTAEAVIAATTGAGPEHCDARAIVDVTGVGGGVVDMARRDGAPVVEFVAAGRARDHRRYANVRAEAFFALRTALRDGLLDLEDGDVALRDALRAVRWTTDRLGRLLIESKDDLRGRGVGSPDRADALAMVVWHDQAWRHSVPLSPADELAAEIARIRRAELEAARRAETAEGFFSRTGPGFERGMARRGLQW